MDAVEGISSKDEVTGHMLGMSFKVMFITAEIAQTEELGVGNREIGVGRVEEGEVLIGE